MSRREIDAEAMSRIAILATAAPGFIAAALLATVWAFAPARVAETSAMLIVGAVAATSLGTAFYLLMNRRREGAARRIEIVARLGAPVLVLLGLASVSLSLPEKGVAAFLDLPPYLFAAAVAGMLANKVRAAAGA